MRLAAVNHPWPDRVAVLRFVHRRVTGAETERSLVMELLGKHCNLLLLTPDGRVDRPLYRPALTDQDARALPGTPYEPPGFPAGPGIHNLLEAPPSPEADLSGESRELAERFVPLPPLAGRAAAALPEGERGAFLARLHEVLAGGSACWYRHRDDRDRPFLYPVALPDREAEPAGPFGEAWPALVEASLREAQREQRRQTLERRVRKQRKRLTDRQEKVAADEARHADPDHYRRLGQALLAAGGGQAHGETVTATDYFADPPQPIEVPVRPGHSLPEEANRYFQRARKAERGQEQAARRRYETDTDLEEVARLEADLADEPDDATLASVADRLARLEGIPAEQRHGTQHKGAETAGEPLRLEYAGHTILVGDTRTTNDRLTFRLARPWDLWFHVQGLPGTHVVLRRERKDPVPDDEVLDYCARLAVTYSPKAGSKAEVDWTEVKHVRRHPNGKPGQALYEHFKTRMAEALEPSEQPV
jgi:predicted ribosome quality control (RQC) complex YloA/Tae2 family protein